jgi:hypothetical protein
MLFFEPKFDLTYYCNTEQGIIFCPNIEQCDPTQQRQNTEISKQTFPEKEYWGLSPNFHIHVSVIDLYIPSIRSAYSAGGNTVCEPLLGVHM